MAAISWGLGALIAIVLLFKKRLWRWLCIPNLLAFFSFVSLNFPLLIPLLDQERQQSFRELSVQIKQDIKPEEEIFLLGFTRYSIVYYSEHPVNFIYNTSKLKRHLLENQKYGHGKSILILGESNYLEDSELSKIDYDLVSQKGAYQLIRIKDDSLSRFMALR